MQNAARWGRLGLTLLLAAWGFAILRDPTDTITHILILPIHETGHYLFMPFGELMYAAGGSIFQLLFPALFIVHFLRAGDKHAATVPLWFVGVSAADLSVYVKDAHAGDLELIGGEHDWSFILSELTLVHRDQEIGQAVYLFGALCVAAAVLLGVLWLPKPVEST